MKALNLVAAAALLFSVGMARAEGTTAPTTPSNEPAKVSEQKPVEGQKVADTSTPSKKKHKRHGKKEVKK